MDEQTQDIGLGVVLSITTGRLLCPISEVYNFLNWMSRDNLYTHQLPRVAEEARPVLLEQHPILADIDVPQLDGEGEYRAWLETMSAVYGEQVSCTQLLPSQHERMDPIAELVTMRMEEVEPDA